MCRCRNSLHCNRNSNNNDKEGSLVVFGWVCRFVPMTSACFIYPNVRTKSHGTKSPATSNDDSRRWPAACMFVPPNILTNTNQFGGDLFDVTYRRRTDFKLLGIFEVITIRTDYFIVLLYGRRRFPRILSRSKTIMGSKF